jgi:excisionase family DNA binding protein
LNSPYLKTTKAAKMLGVSRDVIVKWINQSDLPAIKTPGGHFRVLISDVEKLQEKIKFNPNV